MKNFTFICFIAIFIIQCSTGSGDSDYKSQAEKTLTAYFDALHENDRNLLKKTSIDLSKRTFGENDIIEISQPAMPPYQFPQLLKSLDKMQAEKKEKMSSLLDLDDEVSNLEDKLKISRTIAERDKIKKELTDKKNILKTEKQNYNTLNAQLMEIRKKIDLEKRILVDRNNLEPEDLKTGTGKEILIRARIKTVSGNREKHFLFLLKGYDLNLKNGHKVIPPVIIEIVKDPPASMKD